MNILTDNTCENCGKLVGAIIVSDDHPLVFCSKECFTEYRLFDGGDDGYYDDEPADDTDTI